ncbi:MAG: transketolase [Candidatus Paceibacteria bacterium]|jgi:transketolase
MTLTRERIEAIEAFARQIRVDVVNMVHAAACGHPGGPIGMADFMATLWMEHINISPENLHDPARDRFVLGNGHTCAGYYSVLAQKGILPREDLITFRKFGSRLQGHPHRSPEMGIDMSTGSLGTGLSTAQGMALAARINGWDDTRVYATSSDGESQEGQIWEAATSAAHYGLGNLTVLVDFNNIQIDGKMREVMNVRDLRQKYEAFGWHAVDVDGHDVIAIDQALSEAKSITDRPSALICKTLIGKGVSFMEDQSGWHGVAPNDEQAKAALAELGA